MQKPEPINELVIPISSLKTELIIYPEGRSECYQIPVEKTLENNESQFQLLEGNFYEFKFTDSENYTLSCEQKGIINLSRDKFRGRICPNIFVGKLKLKVIEISTNVEAEVYLEVLATKFNNILDTSYRESYRMMLEDITVKATDLLMQINSPVQQSFTIDFDNDYKTLYQRFCFVNSIVNNEDFENAVSQVVKNPSVKWIRVSECIPIQQVKRVTRSVTRQITAGSNRIAVQDPHLNSIGLTSLPQKIQDDRKTESIDTNENRFIKHALEVFLQFSNVCKEVFNQKAEYHNQAKEAQILVQRLDGFLNQSFFKEVGKPDSLQLNSPVLQRRAGYREILNRWLQFDLAAKLIWKGGDDVYDSGKKDIATLYEYWLFFKLLDLFQSHFAIEKEELSKLIVSKENGLRLQLKQGYHTALKGIFNSGSRKLNVKFNYNRSFKGKQPYPVSGSWTTIMRPDYTLSFWPVGMKESEAENEEIIVHIHFDAKYKVDKLFNIDSNLNEDEQLRELDEEKKDNRKGIYKNADLLKMHAYKDAIRRTGGAYVLYPGDQELTRKGFHEIIPGLGAFPIRPSKTDDGTTYLKSFITEVIEHFTNRTSQREKHAYRTFDIHKDKPSNDTIVNDMLPETFGSNRGLFADDTYVLVGYYKSPEHLEWIRKNGIYNFRMNSSRGSLKLNKEVITAKYLLLHSKGDTYSGLLCKITQNNFEITTKKELQDLLYPTEPSADLYLTTRIDFEVETELKGFNWKFMNLENYKTGRNSALPYTASLKELLKYRISKQV